MLFIWMRRGREVGPDEIPMEFWMSTNTTSMEWLTSCLKSLALQTVKIP